MRLTPNALRLPASLKAAVRTSLKTSLKTTLQTTMGTTAVLGAAFLAWSAVAPEPLPEASAKPGRVVRIERATARAGKDIRACQYSRMGTDALLTCIGKSDFDEGDVFDVLGEDGSFARAQVKTVKPAQIDTCKLGYAVDLDARVFDEVPAPNSTGYTRQFAVRGLDITPGVSKLLSTGQMIQSPSGNSRDSVLMAVDTDADDQADFLAVLAECPKGGKKPWVPSGRTLQSHCVDYWTRSGPDWTKSSHQEFHYCQ